VVRRIPVVGVFGVERIRFGTKKTVEVYITCTVLYNWIFVYGGVCISVFWEAFSFAFFCLE
jgi:hypothetical protein